MRREKVHGVYTNQTVKHCGTCCNDGGYYGGKPYKKGFGKVTNGVPEITYNIKQHKAITSSKKYNCRRWTPVMYTPKEKRIKKVFREDSIRYKFEHNFEVIETALIIIGN
ncbi:unnamed protein product [Blepharisma stoltei]|uniref:Uncharacterized protein n=1 Tax=Blepharisma stoltei TaxID=1481888 RepID=A0AAU9JTQ9_9CILI|nr:unnamed protein product [Blepharisma stoltei]